MNNGGSSSQANSANAVQEPWYKQYFIYLIIAACVVGLILVSCVIITFVCCRRRGTDKEDIAPVKNSKPTKTVSNDSKDYKRKKNKQEQAKNTTPYGGRSLYGGESSQDVGQGRRLNLRQSYTADSSNLSSPA